MVHTDVINLRRHVLCMQLFTCRVLLELQFKIHTRELHFILKGNSTRDNEIFNFFMIKFCRMKLIPTES